MYFSVSDTGIVGKEITFFFFLVWPASLTEIKIYLILLFIHQSLNRTSHFRCTDIVSVVDAFCFYTWIMMSNEDRAENHSTDDKPTCFEYVKQNMNGFHS